MRFPFFLVLFLMSGVVCAQDSTLCEVYRFTGKDSLAQMLIANQTLNSRGRIIHEYRKENTSTGEAANENYFEERFTFRDTLITECVQNNSGKITKYVYEYDEQGRRFRESVFNWELDQTQNFQQQATGRNDVKGKWVQVSLATIAYDAKGRKMQWDASRLHNTAETNVKWEYDDQNRVTSEKTTMRNGRIVRRTDYQYFDWGYRYWTINYDADGNPRHELEAGQGYQPMIIHAVSVNKAGRAEKDVTSDEKGITRGTVRYQYDAKGRIAREISQRSGQDDTITLVYHYK